MVTGNNIVKGTNYHQQRKASLQVAEYTCAYRTGLSVQHAIQCSVLHVYCQQKK